MSNLPQLPSFQRVQPNLIFCTRMIKSIDLQIKFQPYSIASIRNSLDAFIQLIICGPIGFCSFKGCLLRNTKSSPNSHAEADLRTTDTSCSRTRQIRGRRSGLFGRILQDYTSTATSESAGLLDLTKNRTRPSWSSTGSRSKTRWWGSEVAPLCSSSRSSCLLSWWWLRKAQPHWGASIRFCQWNPALPLIALRTQQEEWLTHRVGQDQSSLGRQNGWSAGCLPLAGRYQYIYRTVYECIASRKGHRW